MTDDANWNYEFGKDVHAMFERAKDDRGNYGTRVVPRVAKTLEYPNYRFVLACVLVFNRWPDKRLFQSIAHHGERRNPLSWAHLVYLSEVADDNLVRILADKAFDHCLTPEQLLFEISRYCRREKLHVREQLRIRSVSLKQCLTNVASTTQTLEDRLFRMIEEFDIVTKWKQLSAEQMTAELPDMVQDALNELDKLQTRIVSARQVYAQLLDPATRDDSDQRNPL
jgi:hypothetical protein